MSDEEYTEEPAAEETEETTEAADAGDDAADETYDDPAADEPADDDYKEPAAEPEPEPEPAAEVSYDAPAGDYDPDSAWAEISKDGNAINWYAVVFDGKALEFDRAGTGGLSDLSAWLAEQSDKILFCLLRVNPGDSSGSSRAKFVFIRFIGKGVGVMKKAKAGTVGGKVDEMFPVKHISLDLSNDEHLATQLSLERVAKEFLRVGGAHKPEFYDFGPGQRFTC